VAEGCRAAETWLAAAERPTGVVCFSDVIASGFVRRLRSSGVCIPAEVSVTGVDDSPLAEAAAVPLTTLRAPAEDMGRRAAELLLSGTADAAYKEVLNWVWVVRDSVGRAPSAA
jgi:LacI family transcriptional regulator